MVARKRRASGPAEGSRRSAPERVTDDPWERKDVQREHKSFSGPKPGLNLPRAEEEALKKAGPLAYLKLFFTDSIMALIARRTNRYGKKKEASWENITAGMLWAFFGIMLHSGIVQTPEIEFFWRQDRLYWSEISELMSVNLFKRIRRNLHFSEPLEKTLWPKTWKIQNLLNKIQERFRAVYNPTEDLAVDESMCKFKGRSSIKQYLPLKPIKHGYKFWVIACSNWVCY
jgi:hypothetical protein